MHHNGEYKPQGAYGHVPFASVNPFMRIVAMLWAFLDYFDGLCSKSSDTWMSVFLTLYADFFPKMVLHCLPYATPTETIKGHRDDAPWGKALGEHAPLAAAALDIMDGIIDISSHIFPWSSRIFRIKKNLLFLTISHHLHYYCITYRSSFTRKDIVRINEVNRFLKGAGYAASQVDRAVSNAFKDAGRAVKNFFGF